MPSKLQAWDLGVVQHGQFIVLSRTHSRQHRDHWMSEPPSAPGMEKAYHERWDDGCRCGEAITASGKDVRV